MIRIGPPGLLPVFLLLAGLPGCAQPPAPTQAAGVALPMDAARCSPAVLGASIPPAAIGEPVSGVVLAAPIWTDAGAGLPGYCSVDGQMLPIDTSATAQPIKFRVVMPAGWQGRAMQFGGGGLDGVVPQLLADPISPPQPGVSELHDNIAVYGSDSGHANDPRWALNDEAVRNLGYMQLKKTHDAAMVLIQRGYGVKPRTSYFVGQSQGGREALTVMQRYPRDYDGVAVGTPIVSFSTLMLAPGLIRDQEKRLANWVPPVKAAAIVAEFMRQCDGLDGTQDGVIDNYIGCRAIFDVTEGAPHRHPWARKLCPRGIDPDPADSSAKACLTPGQMATLEVIFSPYRLPIALANNVTRFGMWAPTTDPNGRMQFPPAPPQAPGAAAPRLRGPGQLLAGQRFRDQEGAPPDAPQFFHLGAIGVSGFLMHDLTADPLLYVDGQDPARRLLLSQWLDATNPDLSEFFGHGGKLVMVIGTNDTVASTGSQLDYDQALVDTMGARLTQSARLYVVPQAGHFLIGASVPQNVPVPAQFDRVALLRHWVEDGVAPNAVTVTGGGQTRPLCTYPMYPRMEQGQYHCAMP